MIVVHATPKRNFASIMRTGLRPDRSRSRDKTVYLCSAHLFGNAVRHCTLRHPVDAEDVIIVAVDVPRSWLMKGKRPGLWRSSRTIPPERIAYTVALTVLSV